MSRTRHGSTRADRYRAARDRLLAAAEVRRGARKRGLVMALVAFVGLASMFELVSQNVLAVDFSTTNTPFQLYTNYLQGQEVAAYLNRSSRQDGADVPLAELGVKTANLSGLCMIDRQSVLGVPYSLVLTAGDPVAGSFGFQTTPALTDPNYYLPTGWSAGTDVWGSEGTNQTTQYPGALKGARAANEVHATDLYLNSSSLAGAGYKINGLYLGERAQDVGPNAGVSWESGSGAPGPTSNMFGLRVDHLNLAGAALSAAVPATPGTQAVPATSGTAATITAVTGNVASTSGEPYGNLADIKPTTKYYTGTTPTASAPIWVEYQLSQPEIVNRYSLTTGSDTASYTGRSPTAWTVQGSNDGSSWTTVDTESGGPQPTTNSAIKTYPVQSPAPYTYYRINFTASGGGLQLADWTLTELKGAVTMNGAGSSAVVYAATSNQAGSGTEAIGSLADNSTSTKWYEATTPTSSSPVWAEYQLAEPAKITGYTLVTGGDTASYSGRNPTAWTVQGSNDGSTWSTLSTVTSGGLPASNNASVTYSIANPGVYAYYRLSFTASGGALQLDDWTLGAPVSTVPAATPAAPATPGTPADTAGGAYGLELDGAVNLPDLRIRVVPGSKSQSYCPTAAQ